MIRMIMAAILGCLLCGVMVSCTSRKESGAKEALQAFGKCPKCGTSVVGGVCLWDGNDDKGNPVSGVFYQGVCPSCKAELTTGDTTEKTNVIWKETIKK